MKEQKIIIDIDDKGGIVGDVIGMQGISCMHELDNILKDLARAVEYNPKSEYFSQGQKESATMHNYNRR